MKTRIFSTHYSICVICHFDACACALVAEKTVSGHSPDFFRSRSREQSFQLPANQFGLLAYSLRALPPRLGGMESSWLSSLRTRCRLCRDERQSVSDPPDHAFPTDGWL